MSVCAFAIVLCFVCTHYSVIGSLMCRRAVFEFKFAPITALSVTHVNARTKTLFRF